MTPCQEYLFLMEAVGNGSAKSVKLIIRYLLEWNERTKKTPKKLVELRVKSVL